MLDFNSRLTKAKAISTAIGAVLDAAMMDRDLPDFPRDYLGASSLGHECLRRIQWDWLSPRMPEPRTERIFARGCSESIRNLGIMNSSGHVPLISTSSLRG